MKDALKRKRHIEEIKTQPLFLAHRTKRPAHSVRLNGHSEAIWRVLALPTEALIATACSDHAVRVYNVMKPRAPPQVLEMHTGEVFDLAALGGDVVVSVGGDGRIVTWSARAGKMLDALRLNSTRLFSVATVSSDCFVTGNAKGDLVYYRHIGGAMLRKVAHCRWAHSKDIEFIAAHRHLMVAASYNNCASIWDVRTRIRLGVLIHDNPVWRVSISDDYIATLSIFEVRLYSTRRDFMLAKRFTTKSYITALNFVGNDMLALGDESGVVSFVDPSASKATVSVKTSVKRILTLCPVPNDKVAVASFDGVCALVCLSNERAVVQEFRNHFRMLPSTSLVAKCGHACTRRKRIALVSVVAPLLFFFLHRKRF